jgi:hypothetical protein
MHVAPLKRPKAGLPVLVQVAFAFDAAAVAAVQLTRRLRQPTAAGQLPPRDILLLHPTGRLSVCLGSRLVCNVSVPMRGGSPLAQYTPFVATAHGRTVSPSGLPTVLFLCIWPWDCCHQQHIQLCGIAT